MNREYNEEILKCGLEYDAHNDRTRILVVGKAYGIVIPLDRVSEFCELFPDVDWEDGAFLQELNGRYVRVVTDGQLNIIAIKHIVKDLTYWMDKDGGKP